MGLIKPPDPSLIWEQFHDHPTFARECLSIADENGAVVPMTLQPAQLKLNEGIRQQREAGKPVRIVYLKARRVMVSSATAGQFFQSTAFTSGQHCLVVAHKKETATNILEFYKGFQQYYRPLAGMIRLPELVKSPDGKIEWENGSWIRVGTANDLDLGRSYNIRRLQLDEYGAYRDAKELRVAVMAAVPKDAETMVIIPSTAKGVGTDFHNLWLKATDPQTKSDWLGIFCAWWEHPANKYALDLPPDRFQASLDGEEREIKARYNLSLQQLMWRRWVIRNDFDGDVTKFRQEHPGNPEEAFLASGRMRYDVQTIQRMPVQRDAVVGGLDQSTIGIEKRIVFLPREKGELMLFRRPQAGRYYVIGADTAEGIDAAKGSGDADPDYSVGQVLDRDSGEQVAVLRARLTPSAFGEYLYWLGCFYNWAQIIPEVNSIGVGTIDQMLRLNYPPHLFYHRRRQPDEDPSQRSDNIGWKTTSVTRQQLLARLDTALRELSIAVHDPTTINELMTFVYKPNGKAEAQTGCHDDTVIALALAVVGITEMARPIERSKSRGAQGDSLERGRVTRLLR